MFLIMVSVYGATIVLNVINYGTEINWHTAMSTYGGNALLANEKYSNSAMADDVEEGDEDEMEGEGEWLMTGQDWSW